MSLREELRIARLRVESALRAYLKAGGWQETCQSPAGAWWRWEKEINGKVYLCDSDTAEKIEDRIDEFPKLRAIFACKRCGEEVSEGEEDHNRRHPYCGGELDPIGDVEEEPEDA